MCGRYVSPDDAAIERYFTIDRRTPHPLARHFNVAPTTLVPIVRKTREGLTELAQARWGLVRCHSFRTTVATPRKWPGLSAPSKPRAGSPGSTWVENPGG